jgi:hypothetical protein
VPSGEVKKFPWPGPYTLLAFERWKTGLGDFAHDDESSGSPPLYVSMPIL